MIALANKYIEKENVDALILACTELPLAIKPEDVKCANREYNPSTYQCNLPICNSIKIAKPAEPVNGQDERRISCAAVDSPARLC